MKAPTVAAALSHRFASGSWRSALALLAPLMLVLSPLTSSAPSAPNIQSTFGTQEEFDEMKADVNAVSCKDSDRLNAVRALFERMGAGSSDLSVVTYKRVQNVVVTKRGSGSADERIVVGAHYDKTAKGCGTVDNWTGVVAMAYIYKSLKAVPLNKTVVFVAFGKEEEGLIGSHAMVEAIPKEELPLYCGMVNIDSLGMGIPQVIDNMSCKKLEQLAAGVAKQMSIQYGHVTVEGAASDSNSFLARKIPALTISGLNNEWHSVLHTDADQRSKVNPASVYLCYRLALAVLDSIDKANCDAFR